MTEKHSWVLSRPICWVVMVAFCLVSLIPASSQAGLVESRMADGVSLSQRAAQIDTIRQALEREVVSQRLADFGLSAEEVSAKLDTLSDAQLHQLSGLSKDLAAGGILEGIIAVLIIVLLVIVILKLTNKQIIIR
ncbi:hypothetical protein DESUT3_31670 [Desulfuromonas versatilis]|uniref:PA2779 family protein n=1 Tax=Desulfuromonas versatilis TaxID=2802975 RepID=A0ABN6E156_9BACT|nr:PA2779 family protein [Desulfuromonas versatilis]BCR06098.1 hypothetical protein DESUT3_31670 [Desulfuromonas versatilis]